MTVESFLYGVFDFDLTVAQALRLHHAQELLGAHQALYQHGGAEGLSFRSKISSFDKF